MDESHFENGPTEVAVGLKYAYEAPSKDDSQVSGFFILRSRWMGIMGFSAGKFYTCKCGHGFDHGQRPIRLNFTSANCTIAFMYFFRIMRSKKQFLAMGRV